MSCQKHTISQYHSVTNLAVVSGVTIRHEHAAIADPSAGAGYGAPVNAHPLTENVAIADEGVGRFFSMVVLIGKVLGFMTDDGMPDRTDSVKPATRRRTKRKP